MDWSDESIVNTLASLAARARDEQVRSNGDPELFGTPPPPITENVGYNDKFARVTRFSSDDC